VHVSVEVVVGLVVERAPNPRADYKDAHFDRTTVPITDTYRTESWSTHSDVQII
jgi:hypothetical protein